MNYRILLEQVQNHVEQLYKTHNASGLLYHNLTHTQKVVEAVTQIANHYALNDHDFFIVVTAAWFHDIGYLHATAGHEEISADEAAALLIKLDVTNSVIEQVKHCILATKLPQRPTNLLEEIICDADLFHFGTDDFTENNKRMRKEAKLLYHKDFTKEEWRNKTIELLQSHNYFTAYCRNTLNEKKQANLDALLNKQHKADMQDEDNKPAAETINTAGSNKANKEKRPDRGIETMFRVASSNHQKLSDMADNKSHILITVNSIIISVVVSLLLRKLDENNHLIIPAIILLLVSLVTIVLSILATRPNIPNGTFTQQELDDKTTNLLFFGNFFRMSLNSYKEGMLQMMNDHDFLYGSLIKDIYAQGVVLGKKYKLLHVAYNVFMFGLIISVVAFIVASIITS
ncbi:Pycsar system effector family protein [Parafilimonas sp.]|uniref:Pycsar system effector family protein n=1 Tax=Parafilimonas sp. TaxID=1969739 RepID=UPI0039E3E4BD